MIETLAIPPFVILDRDGVINVDSPDYIKSAEEWQPLPGSLEAIARLTTAGYQIFVATNQAGIARGKLSLMALDVIHKRMLREVERHGGKIRDIQYCPHHPCDHCECRKPKPGMLVRLAEIHDLDLSQGYFVGDSLKDLKTAEAAGCKGVLVCSDNEQHALTLKLADGRVHADLAAFVDEILTV